MTSADSTSFLHIPSSRPMLKKRHTTPTPLDHLSTLEAMPAPTSARTPTIPSFRRAISPPPAPTGRPPHSKQSSFLPFELPPVVVAMLDLPLKSPARSSQQRHRNAPPSDLESASPHRWSAGRNKDVMPSIEVVMGLSSAPSSVRSKPDGTAPFAAGPSRAVGGEVKDVGRKPRRDTLKLPLMSPPMSGTRSPVPPPSGQDDHEDADWDFIDHVARRPSYQSSLRSEYERMDSQRSHAPRPRVRSQDYPSRHLSGHNYGLAFDGHDSADDPNLSAAGILEELSGHLLEQEWPDELAQYGSLASPSLSRSRAGTTTTGQSYLSDTTLPSYHESSPPSVSDDFGSDALKGARQSKDVKSVRSWREARKKSKQPSSPRPLSEQQPPARLRKPSLTHGRPAAHPPPTVPLPQLPASDSPESLAPSVEPSPRDGDPQHHVVPIHFASSSDALARPVADDRTVASMGDAPPIPPRSAARPRPSAENPTKLYAPQRKLSGSAMSDPTEGLKVPLVHDANRLSMLRPGGEDMGIVEKVVKPVITPVSEMALWSSHRQSSGMPIHQRPLPPLPPIGGGPEKRTGLLGPKNFRLLKSRSQRPSTAPTAPLLQPAPLSQRLPPPRLEARDERLAMSQRASDRKAGLSALSFLALDDAGRSEAGGSRSSEGKAANYDTNAHINHIIPPEELRQIGLSSRRQRSSVSSEASFALGMEGHRGKVESPRTPSQPALITPTLPRTHPSPEIVIASPPPPPRPRPGTAGGGAGGLPVLNYSRPSPTRFKEPHRTNWPGAGDRSKSPGMLDVDIGLGAVVGAEEFRLSTASMAAQCPCELHGCHSAHPPPSTGQEVTLGIPYNHVRDETPTPTPRSYNFSGMAGPSIHSPFYAIQNAAYQSALDLSSQTSTGGTHTTMNTAHYGQSGPFGSRYTERRASVPSVLHASLGELGQMAQGGLLPTPSREGQALGGSLGATAAARTRRTGEDVSSMVSRKAEREALSQWLASKPRRRTGSSMALEGLVTRRAIRA